MPNQPIADPPLPPAPAPSGLTHPGGRMYQCPHCSSIETERVRRAVWMSLFPRMIRVFCRSCERLSTMFTSHRPHRKLIDL